MNNDPNYTDLYGGPIPLCDPCHDADCRPAAPAGCKGGDCGCGCRGFYLAPIPAPRRRSGVEL